MKIILLDDERNYSDIYWISYPKHDEVIVLRTYQQFKNFVDNLDSLKDLLFTFDHDIQDFHSKGEYTGFDCVKYLIELIQDNTILNINDLNYCVHSMNPIGAANIKNYIENFKDFCNR